MKNLCLLTTTAFALLSGTAMAQEDENGVFTELELGAITTTGNTEDESFNIIGSIDWVRDEWEYSFSLDAFRSSRQDVLTAERYYYVASAAYDLSEVSYIESRLAHEEDSFSGYDSQTDATVNYGRTLLTARENMSLDYTAGIGYRNSQTTPDDFDEVIFRLAGEYEWQLSDSAVFDQVLSAEAGDETSIFRSITSIETKILENLSLKLSFRIKHQTEVPVGREKTDTATAVTLVMNF